MILTRMWSSSDTRLTLSFPDFVFEVVEMLFKATTLQMKFAGGGSAYVPWEGGRKGAGVSEKFLLVSGQVILN